MLQQEQVSIISFSAIIRPFRPDSKGTQWTWFGHERALICFPIVGHSTFLLLLHNSEAFRDHLKTWPATSTCSTMAPEQIGMTS